MLLEAGIRDVLFRDCQLDLVQMRFSRLHRVWLDSCSMKEADLYSGALVDVVFTSRDLSGADLSQAEITNLDLRTSTIEGFRLGAETLRGEIMDPAQVLSMANLLGYGSNRTTCRGSTNLRCDVLHERSSAWCQGSLGESRWLWGFSTRRTQRCRS